MLVTGIMPEPLSYGPHRLRRIQGTSKTFPSLLARFLMFGQSALYRKRPATRAIQTYSCILHKNVGSARTGGVCSDSEQTYNATSMARAAVLGGLPYYVVT